MENDKSEKKKLSLVEFGVIMLVEPAQVLVSSFQSFH